VKALSLTDVELSHRSLKSKVGRDVYIKKGDSITSRNFPQQYAI